jgi:hypothetical protein
MDTTPKEAAPKESSGTDATLNDILWIAFRNSAFLETLLKKPEAALLSADLRLSTVELAALKSMLRKKFVMDGKHMIWFVNQMFTAAGITSVTTIPPKPPTPPPPPPPPPWYPDPPLMPIPPVHRVKVAKGKSVTKKRSKKRPGEEIQEMMFAVIGAPGHLCRSAETGVRPGGACSRLRTSG